MFSLMRCIGTWPGPSFMTWQHLAPMRALVSSPKRLEFAELCGVVGVGDWSPAAGRRRWEKLTS